MNQFLYFLSINTSSLTTRIPMNFDFWFSLTTRYTFLTESKRVFTFVLYFPHKKKYIQLYMQSPTHTYTALKYEYKKWQLKLRVARISMIVMNSRTSIPYINWLPRNYVISMCGELYTNGSFLNDTIVCFYWKKIR